MKRAKPTKPSSDDVKNMTEADGVAFMSFCIQVTAGIALEFENSGNADPGLYDGLKALQLVFDRRGRALEKSGMKRTFPEIPEVPEPKRVSAIRLPRQNVTPRV